MREGAGSLGCGICRPMSFCQLRYSIIIKSHTNSESTRLGTAITASFCLPLPLSTLITVCAGMEARENRQKLSALVGNDRLIEGL